MIDMGVVLQVERDTAPIVEHYRHAHPIDILDRAEQAILHAHVALVSKER
ncbi:MAG: hypothetical protein IPF76_01180 [Sphingopyxis sp.]|nr:hypothetical protein [Sphingopyxis sp.]